MILSKSYKRSKFVVNSCKSLNLYRRLTNCIKNTPDYNFIDGIGHLAKSNSTCMLGGTFIHTALCSIVSSGEYQSMLPLTVDYKIKEYASGNIPKSIKRRERHGTEDEILVARIIDRTIRPLFPKPYHHDIQITSTVHSLDPSIDTIVATVNNVSICLLKANMGWLGPVGCVRIGYIDNQLILNPSNEELDKSKLNLLISGTNDRILMIEAICDEIPEPLFKEAMNLAQEGLQKMITHQQNYYQKYIQLKQNNSTTTSCSSSSSSGISIQSESSNTVINTDENTLEIQDKQSYPDDSPSVVQEDEEDVIIVDNENTNSTSLPIDSNITTTDNDNTSTSNIINKLNHEITTSSSTSSSTCTSSTGHNDTDKKLSSSSSMMMPEGLKDYVYEIGYQPLKAFFEKGIQDRKQRSLAEGGVRSTILTQLQSHDIWSLQHSYILNIAVDYITNRVFRECCENNKRPDGRTLDKVRQVTCHPGIIPEPVHGSAYFTRGDTHVLCTVTLGSKDDAIMENYNKNEIKQSFYLHYDFPPYSTGVLGNATSINRRMIGHGNLAERAMQAIIPNFENFPYVIRVASECTSSSGSSSMASVCGASLALMDAGVPIYHPAAGVSIGLVTTIDPYTKEEKYTLLTDIIGSEDHYGDMDFKIAGTKNGITAAQLDVKLPNGVPNHILQDAIDKARDGRLSILKVMNQSITSSRSKLKHSAPAAERLIYNPIRKKFIVGANGEIIRHIQKLYKVTIDLDMDGEVYIYGINKKQVRIAKDLISDMVIMMKEGEILDVEIKQVKDYGALVRVSRIQSAMLHISEVTHNQELIKRPLKEILKVGQKFKVKVLFVDETSGMMRVSRKQLLDPAVEDSVLLKSLSAETMSDVPETMTDDILSNTSNGTLDDMNKTPIFTPDISLINPSITSTTTTTTTKKPKRTTTNDGTNGVASVEDSNEEDNEQEEDNEEDGEGEDEEDEKLLDEIDKTILATVPDFPIAPPRSWNKDYFRTNVATMDDVEAAIRRERE